jgi:ketosteroid isomerase-like protein
LPRRSGGHHHNLFTAAESIPLSAFSFHGGDEMKTLTVFFVLAVLFTLTGCVTQEIQVTRVVKETVIEQVEVTREVEGLAAFDAEAVREELESVSKEYYDAFVAQDMEAIRRLESEDWIGFYGFYDYQGIGVIDENTYVPNPDVIGTKITIDNREWIISPEFAIAKSSESWLWPGASSENHYLLTLVWEKKDGQWKLAHEHVSEYTP